MNDKIHKILDVLISVGSFFSPKTLAFKMASILGIIKPVIPGKDEKRDER